MMKSRGFRNVLFTSVHFSMFIFKVLQDIYNKYTLNVAVNAKNMRKVDLKIPGNTDNYIQIQNKQNKNDG